MLVPGHGTAFLVYSVSVVVWCQGLEGLQATQEKLTSELHATKTAIMHKL